MKVSISVALLALALSGCNADRTSSAADTAEPTAAPAANSPAPTPLDQPPENVPPATAPVAGQPEASGVGDAEPARFDGYGDMRFGMDPAAFKAAWKGDLKGKPATGDGCYLLAPAWAKTPADMAFMFEGDKFVRYGTGNSRLVAPGGGKVGMSTNDIGRIYIGRVQETPHKYVEGGKVLSIEDTTGSKSKLVFETDKDGKVTQWRVGLPPQVDYVEGCS